MLARALAVFAFTYVLIIARRLRWIPIGRPAGAFAGACLAVALRTISPEQAFAAIDPNTIGLLFGMMLVNAHLEHAGAFARVARWFEKKPESPKILACAVAVSSGIGAALLVNDAVCLMGTPTVLAIARQRKIHPLPLLLALACGSNVGGVMTLTGTPQCMLVGRLGHLSYTSYAAAMIPVGLVGLAILCVVLVATWQPLEAKEAKATPSHTPIDPSLFAPSLLVLALITAGFLARFDLAWTALCGSALLLMLARRDAAAMLARVDWSVLVFFSGLFVVVGSLRSAGAVTLVRESLGDLLAGGASAAWPFAAFTVVVCQLVSNVPFVLLVAPWLEHASDERLLWLLLSMASTFAGNFTLLGSVANILVAEGSGEEGGVTFTSYLRVGLPTTLFTTIAGTFLLLAMHSSGYLRMTAHW